MNDNDIPKIPIMILFIFLFLIKNIDCACEGCLDFCENNKCSWCSEGYYLQNENCYKCINGCKKCSNGNDCEECDTGYYYLFQSCYKCDSACVSCTSSNNCLNCYMGNYLSNGKCIKCDTSCKQCKYSPTYCISCKNTLFYLSSNNSCLACNEPCRTCSDQITCLSCIDGYYLYKGTCYKCNSNCKEPIDNCICLNCEEGYYLLDQHCLKCDQKCKTCQDTAGKCLTCNEKYYLSSNNLCSECQAPCNTCIDEKICTSCVDNYFFFSGNCYPCNINCKTSFDGCRCATCKEGYYFNQYQCLKCDQNCKTCSGSNSKCLSCYSNKFLFNNSCIDCVESSGNINCTKIYENKTNQIYEEEKEAKFYDEILENIESFFTSEKYDTSILDSGEDEILEINKLKIVLTTSSNQKNASNNNNNISSVDLGQCEVLLKKFYNISEEKALYITKLEIIQEGMKIPKIEYCVYYNLNEKKLEKLNIAICKNTNISLILPLEINENLDELNKSSGYYNDICYPATSESGTDISLKDRKKEFIEKNKTVCQDDCIFSGYNYTTKKVNCLCKVNEMPLSFLYMKINKTKLYQNFFDIKNIANIKILICYKILFTVNGILYNIGSYIILSIIIFHIVSIILFYLKQFDTIKSKIKNIIFAIKNLKKIKNKKKKEKEKEKNKSKDVKKNSNNNIKSNQLNNDIKKKNNQENEIVKSLKIKINKNKKNYKNKKKKKNKK